MYRDEQHVHDEHDPPVSHSRLDLWYYERRGSRYYLRFTGLAVALISVLVVVSISSILMLYFYQKNTPIEEPNINIGVQPRPAYSPQILIKPAPQLPPPPPVRSYANINGYIPLSTPTPSRNINGR
jgi:hypothetical protein